MSNAQPKIDVGDILDSTYQILGRLGSGGMGEVFRASHLRLPEQDVAIKVLRQQDEDSLARFRREARATSRLGHPNIVTVHDFNALPDGTPYMVLEYLEGEDLAARLTRGACTLEEVDTLLEQICAGLAQAHAAGIIHRDLKPGNIFLCGSPESEVSTAKILDFGISKVSGDKTLTQVAEIVGTPQYMAPEQVTGDNDLISPATDIFSLAIIAYEMLTGNRAFPSDHLKQAVFSIVYEDPPALLECLPELPVGVARAIDAALIKDPTERCASASEFYEAFHAGVEGREWSFASQVTRTPVPKREWSSEEALAAKGSAPTDFAIDSNHDALTNAKPTTSELATFKRLVWIASAIVALVVVGGVLLWWTQEDPPKTVAPVSNRAEPDRLGDQGVALFRAGKIQAAAATLGTAVKQGDHRLMVLTTLQRALLEEESPSVIVGDGEIMGGRLHPQGTEFVALSRSGRVERYDALGQPVEVMADAGEEFATYSYDGHRLVVGTPTTVTIHGLADDTLTTIEGSFGHTMWIHRPMGLLTSSQLLIDPWRPMPAPTLTLWNPDSGEEIWSFQGPAVVGPTSVIGRAAISKRGTSLLFLLDKTLLLDTVTGKLVESFSPTLDPPSKPVGATISPDARWAATADSVGRLLLVDLKTQAQSVLRRPSLEPQSTVVLATNALGSHLLALIDGRVLSYPIELSAKSKLTAAAPIALGPAESIFCSYSNAHCLTRSASGTITAWHPQTGRLLNKVRGEGFQRLEGSAGEKILALRNGKLYLVTESFHLIDLPETYPQQQLTPNGSKLVGWKAGHATLIDIDSGDTTLEAQSPRNRDVAVAENARWIIDEHRVRDSQTGEEVSTLPPGLEVLRGSPTTPHLLGRDGNGLQVFHVLSGTMTALSDSEASNLSSEFDLHWSRDGSRIALLGLSETGVPHFRIANISGETVHRYQAKQSGLMALSPSGSEIATLLSGFLEIRAVGQEGVVRTINVADHSRHLEYLSEHELLFAGMAGKTGVLNTTTGEWVSEWDLCELADLVVPHASPIGAALCADGVVRLFDVKTKERLGDYGGGGDPKETTVLLSPGGDVLVVTSGKTLQRWKILPDLGELERRMKEHDSRLFEPHSP